MPSRIATRLIAGCLAAIAAAALAQQPKEKMLTPCESLDGAKVTYARALPETRIALNTDAQYLSQGKASIHVSSVTKPEPKRSKYVGFKIPVPPTKLDGKALVFDAWTSQPKYSMSLYARGFNAKDKIVASWRAWKHPISAETRTFRLVPGKNADNMAWEPDRIQAPDDTIVAVEFITGSSTVDKPIDLFIDNVRTGAATEPLKQPTALHNCDTLNGVSAGGGSQYPDFFLKVNTDPKFVSQGKGSVHLGGRKPKDAKGSAYFIADFAVPKFDLRKHAIALDAWSSHPKATRGLYVRAYDTGGKCVASWFTWDAELGKKTSLTLPFGTSGTTLDWEQRRVESKKADQVTRVRIYTGTRDPGAMADIYIDNLRLEAASVQPFAGVDAARKRYPNTTLVADGKAQCIVIAPDDKAWTPLARRTADAIAKATGARPEVKPASQIADADLHKINAVVLGNIVNNRRLLYPYSHMMVFADDYYPGNGGYDVRSVHDPWGTGKNMISIGATDLDGAAKAVAVFEKAVAANAKGKSLTLPRFLKAELEGDADKRYGRIFDAKLGKKWLDQQKSAAATSLEAGIHCGLFSPANTIGLHYALTRRADYARAFVWLIQEAKRHHDSDPKTFGGPWGMDSDFRIYSVMPAWKEVEECPDLTDPDRLDVARILFQWVGDVGATKGNARGRRVRFNHQTFPALGCLYAGHYYTKYYHSATGQKWLDIAANTFDLQIGTSKPHCDCNSYQWLTLSHTIRYSLATQNLTYFENGNARKNADYAILTMNNAGRPVAYGDLGSWTYTGNEANTLRMAEWYYRDGRARWALDFKSRFLRSAGLGNYETDVTKPVRPDDMIGVVPWAPVPDLWYKSFLTKSGVEPSETVDKVAFREAWNNDAAYLLIDGLAVGGHGHKDANAVLQWAEDDRIWLADGDYTKGLPKHHCGVLILKDGQSDRIPAAAVLDRAADLPNVGASRTTLRNYSGVDWARNIVWLKGKAFVVVDQMTAKQKGDYSFRAVWQGVGKVAMNDAVLDFEQAGRHARVAMTGDTLGILQEDAELGENWASYPYCNDGMMYVMQGIVNAKLQPGQSAELFSVLHASGDKPSEAQATRVAPNATLVTGIGEPTLVAAGRGGNTTVLPGLLSGDAMLFVASPTRIAAIGARSLTVAGKTQTFATPTDIEIDLAKGTQTVRTDVKAKPVTGKAFSTIDAAKLAKAIDALRSSAAGAAAPPAPPSAPTARQAWLYASVPDRFLLTNNGGQADRLGLGTEITATPKPLDANVFSQQPGANTLSRAFDGQDTGVGNAVMWDDDQEVTINFAFDNVCKIEDIALKHWFATSSSKNKIYQLGRLRILASNDGFRNDKRVLKDVTDTKMHGNWGAPVLTAFDDLNAKAKDLRVILTPRKGTGIYIAEMTVWGVPEGIDIEKAGADLLDPFVCVHAADVDADGAMETLAGTASGIVYCLDAKGKVRWKATTSGRVRTVTAVDFQGNGKPDVIAGGTGARVYCFDGRTGKERWVTNIKPYKKAGHVCTSFPADLGGRGKQSAIVGAENWRYFAFDGQGKKIWQYESVRIATKGLAIDVTGDGKDQIVMGTIYFWWSMANPDGSKRWTYRTKLGPGVTALAGGNVLGSKTPEVIFGGEDTLVQVANGDTGKAIWQFNTGDEVSGLTCANVAGDSHDEVLVTSLSFNAYCLDGDGKTLWRTDLGSPINASVYIPGVGAHGAMAAACENGRLTFLDATTGKPIGQFDLGAMVSDLAATTVDGKPAVAAAGTDGYVRVIMAP